MPSGRIECGCAGGVGASGLGLGIPSVCVMGGGLRMGARRDELRMPSPPPASLGASEHSPGDRWGLRMLSEGLGMIRMPAWGSQ
jgi:hypothetical protein